MSEATMQGLNMDKILNKQIKVISSEEALRGIVPVDWPDEVIKGERKIIVGLPAEDSHV